MTVVDSAGSDHVDDDPAVAVRRRLRVEGLVQGVGFRPFVHRLANAMGLAGWVNNDTEGVTIEVEGAPALVAEFAGRLSTEPPPLARVDLVTTASLEPVGGLGFSIAESRAGGPVATFVSPDAATCEDCLAELLDPADRRYRYPFINCTNCGPRFTITERLPYDRPNTTMAGFAMCGACSAEYSDPFDRRFHAQPVACSECGPQIRFEAVAGAVVTGSDDALIAAQRTLSGGGILALKGVGGFHLVCDALSDGAVAELRRRKGRPAKAVAVMARDLDTAGQVAHISEGEALLLCSVQRPIVLLQRREPCDLTPQVAPGNPLVGIVLPYSPLHHLLLRDVPGGPAAPSMLVVTSGNLSEEPICYQDDDARQRLGPLVDAWLWHDRPIHVPCDDSVVRHGYDAEIPVRRSRGYAPLPIGLPFSVPPLLGVGGELKNAFCIASGRNSWMSQHIGDMGSLETLEAFERSVEQFAKFYRVSSPRLVADMHPGYHTRAWAESSASEPPLLVQHHHAHVASVMTEHGVRPDELVIGVAFDGTGYGTDGTIWGGEILLAGYAGFRRARHLKPIPLPGGDSAVRKPYRSALAHLRASGLDWAGASAPLDAAGASEAAALDGHLRRNTGCVPSSSMGRLFDAVSSLLGICHRATYEAQAAIEMEAVASAGLGRACRYRFEVGPEEIDPGTLLLSILHDTRSGAGAEMIAAGFHLAVAAMICDAARQVRGESGVNTVALTGGVFQNALLERQTRSMLEAEGFSVIAHRLVPPNDGGIALGQVAVAGFRLTGEHPESWMEG